MTLRGSPGGCCTGEGPREQEQHAPRDPGACLASISEPLENNNSARQDWALLEGNLHRAMASYVVERSRCNKTGRTTWACTHYGHVLHTRRVARPGRKMQQLKEIVSITRPEEACASRYTLHDHDRYILNFNCNISNDRSERRNRRRSCCS